MSGRFGVVAGKPRNRIQTPNPEFNLDFGLAFGVPFETTQKRGASEKTPKLQMDTIVNWSQHPPTALFVCLKCPFCAVQ